MGVSPLGPKFPATQQFGDYPTRNNPHPTFGDYQPNGHTGQDYPAPAGTPVYAPEEGVVTYVGAGAALPGDESHDGYIQRYYLTKWATGNVVAIEHKTLGGWVSLNYHLSGFAPGLKNFQHVKRGQLIGYVGSTGRSTGNHDHFDVIPTSYQWDNGMYGRVDPRPYVRDSWDSITANADAKPATDAPGLRTSLTYLTQHDATAYTRGADCLAVFGFARPKVPVSDVLHWWDDPAKRPTFNGTVQWFKSQPPGGVSAHYVVEAGQVAVMVDESNASHANGHGPANAMTVTHECNPRASAQDIEDTAEHLANCWVGRGYTKPGLIELHSDYLQTACPGTYRDRLSTIRDRAGRLFLDKRNGVVSPGTGTGVVTPPDTKSPTPPAAWDGEKLPASGVHTAVKGDSVAGIAKKYGRTIGQIIAWNRYITNPSYIAVGDKVRVSMPDKPAPDREHVTKGGESLGIIALLYGTTIPALVNRNKFIKNPSYLAVGDRVAIPQSNDAVVTAVRGDSPSAIAIRYGTTLEVILSLNPYIKNPNYLAIGDRVRISK